MMQPTKVQIESQGETNLTSILLNGMGMLVSRYAVSSAEPWARVHIELDIPVDTEPLCFTGVFRPHTDADYAAWQQFLAGHDPHTTCLTLRFHPQPIPCEVRVASDPLLYITNVAVRADAEESETWVRLEGWPTEPQDDSPLLVVTGTLHHL